MWAGCPHAVEKAACNNPPRDPKTISAFAVGLGSGRPARHLVAGLAAAAIAFVPAARLVRAMPGDAQLRQRQLRAAVVHPLESGWGRQIGSPRAKRSAKASPWAAAATSGRHFQT